MSTMRSLRAWASKRALIRAVRAALPALRDPSLAWVPPGHFYSPIPGMADRKAALAALERNPESLPGVDLNTEGQMALLERLAHWYGELPFSNEYDGIHRYHYENQNYSYADGIIYACLLQELRPKRVIEIGGGWSSALLLDINEERLGGGTDITFIEPFPKLLSQVTRSGDLEGRLRETPLQAIPPDLFIELDSRDILFVDSTHVVRTGSDVNLFILRGAAEVAPRGLYSFSRYILPV